MNEMQTYQPGAPAIARTPETLGAEVRNLTNAARYITVYYAIEIGRRLTEAKELVAHGEWMDWLKNETELSQSAANRLMRIYAEYGQKMGLGIAPDANSSMLNNLSVSNALRLLAVPEEERETFAETVDAEHLSTRELEEAIRERDAAKIALQATTEELEEAQQLADEETARAEASEKLRAEMADELAGKNMEIEAAKKKIAELESRPIDVAVQEPDPDAVERLAAELANKAIAEKTAEAERLLAQEKAAADRKLAEEKEKAKAAADKLREKLKAAEEKLAGAGAEDKAAAEQLQAEVAALKKKLAMSGERLVTFKLRFAAWGEAYEAVVNAIRKLDEAEQQKARNAVRAQIESWGADDETDT